MFCCSISFFLVLFFVYRLLLWIISVPRRSLSGRFVLVTGCDSGFGHLLAKRLDRLGCHVIAGCLTESGEAELRKSGSHRMDVISLDVTKRDSVRKALQYLQSKLPPGKGLWGVVNNAGTMQKVGPIDWMSVDDFRRQCDVNLWGAVDVTMTLLPLVKREKGRIINMSSAAGRISSPMATAYSLSKYGVECFSDGLRRDLRIFGCKVSLIEPGGFKTPAASPEAFRGAITRAWTEATPEAREEYGQEYFDYLVGVLPDKLTALMSDQLEKVVDAYEHALSAVFPRARYVVGLDAWVLYIGLHALPEWLGDLFWAVVEKTRPTPKALKTPLRG